MEHGIWINHVPDVTVKRLKYAVRELFFVKT